MEACGKIVATQEHKSRDMNIGVDFAIHPQIFASLVIVDLWSQSLQGSRSPTYLITDQSEELRSV